MQYYEKLATGSVVVVAKTLAPKRENGRLEFQRSKGTTLNSGPNKDKAR
jgi:hypothetical protein